VAAQHADQQNVDLAQHGRLGPARQAAAQGRATGLVGRGGQAAPRRALAQEPAQRRHHPDSLGRRVARAAAWRPITSVDHCGDEVQKSEIQCGCPCVVHKLGQPQHRIKDQVKSTKGSCENRFLERDSEILHVQRCFAGTAANTRGLNNLRGWFACVASYPDASIAFICLAQQQIDGSDYAVSQHPPRRLHRGIAGSLVCQ
jgi:hypothetical protein